jgi:putative membrane protein
MDEFISIKYVISAVIFAGIGLLVFVVSFIVLDLITPKANIWKELIEKQNVALAIFLGAIAYGIATIIASAIHG